MAVGVRGIRPTACGIFQTFRYLPRMGFGATTTIFCSDATNGGAPCSGAPSSWSGAGGTSFAARHGGNPGPCEPEVGGARAIPIALLQDRRRPNMTRAARSCNSIWAMAWQAPAFLRRDPRRHGRELRRRRELLHPSGLNGVLSTSEDPFPSAPGISLGFTLSTETSAVSLQELNVNRMKAYGTGPGWDFATGIGTVNGYNLVMNSNW